MLCGQSSGIVKQSLCFSCYLFIKAIRKAEGSWRQIIITRLLTIYTSVKFPVRSVQGQEPVIPIQVSTTGVGRDSAL